MINAVFVRSLSEHPVYLLDTVAEAVFVTGLGKWAGALGRLPTSLCLVGLPRSPGGGAGFQRTLL
jgi:hypothetical protein